MEKRLKKRTKQRVSRAKRVRRHLRLYTAKPRLSVFKSNRHLFVQIIDDETGQTLLGLGTRSKEFRGTKFARKSKESAQKLGEVIAERAKEQKIDEVVFDRGSYCYHGLLSLLADSARTSGLNF
ncbi:MAG: 50S ribosomal protein L18 [Chlamydiota bacterium]